MESVEASHYVGHSQLLLSVLKQRDERALAAVGQLASGHTDVQSFLPKNRLPSGADTSQPSSREGDLDSLVLLVVWRVVVGIA